MLYIFFFPTFAEVVFFAADITISAKVGKIKQNNITLKNVKLQDNLTWFIQIPTDHTVQI